MTIIIPVSRLSLRILLTEYPAHEKSNTIIANSHTLLYRQAYANLPHRRVSTEILQREINVFMPTSVPAISQVELQMLGLMIHQEHKNSMMRWIQATVDAGRTPSYAIRAFYARYDIDEDDFNSESVHRTWQRHVERNVDLLQKPKDYILTPIIKPKEKPIPVIDEDALALFVAEIVEDFYLAETYRHQWNYTLVRDLRLYILSRQVPMLHVSERHGIPYATLHRSVRKVEKWLSECPIRSAAYLKFLDKSTAPLTHDQRSSINRITV